ncbi:MAG: 16S rRNA (cytidine(1402)-2'-O)-methyltransferase [Micrococcales bacterium]|nr:16S rRNA (cytidine(1402)-2'-O)-methyltransferase [Actinomycetota bacterium]NCA07548.1 16S rRNA (cytidine(1402)-2'-O)-methyltransferase [Micrococcales bacterium]
MLILAATPIGNLSDSSSRLIEHLGSSRFIAAEDTRTLLKLANGLGVKLNAKLFSLHEHNEADRVEQLLEIAKYEDVLVVTDAGMPTVSDPGFVLVRAAIEAGIAVTVIPGPSAVLAALAVSGLPTDRFSFEGFLPRKSGERKKFFTDLVTEARTMVFFESPHRIQDSLRDALTVFGPDRRATVSRELTKKFEETARGSLAELLEWAAIEPRGELVLVIAGLSQMEKPEVTQADLLEAVEFARNSGLSLKQSVAKVAEANGVSKSDLYQQVLDSRES